MLGIDTHFLVPLLAQDDPKQTRKAQNTDQVFGALMVSRNPDATFADIYVDANNRSKSCDSTLTIDKKAG
jgi:predicted nucleic-acid-binding protein